MTFVAVVATAAVHVTAAVVVLYVLPVLFWDTLNLPAAPLYDDPPTTEGTHHD